MNIGKSPEVLLATCGSWHFRQTARAFQDRDALAGLWISDKNSTGLPPEKYYRCWPFHLAMKPFYHLASPIVTERAFYSFFPIWRWWLKRQPWPTCNVVQAIMGFATELFARAEPTRALKVLDAPNSHPITYYGIPQSEYDVWSPGARVGVPQWMFARMNRELERADLILCPSTFVRDTMLQFGIPQEKCFINPFGVDTSLFQRRAQLPASPKFIIVGGIGLRKGHHYLFRAFARVKEKMPAAELVCVGRCLDDFRREWRRWKTAVTHHESLSHGQLAELFTQCTAFVFPSLEEGFARVIVEAMAAGLPIVATHESGATTLVQDGQEGIIVRARGLDQLTSAMTRLAQDRVLNQRMGEAARQKGAGRNTWQDYGDRLSAAYESRLRRNAGLKPTLK